MKVKGGARSKALVNHNEVELRRPPEKETTGLGSKKQGSDHDSRNHVLCVTGLTFVNLNQDLQFHNPLQH